MEVSRKNFYVRAFANALTAISFSLQICSSCFAQSNNVGIGTLVPAQSALLDLSAVNKGFLTPRLSDTNLVSSPATGLLIYLTTNNTFYYFNGIYWKALSTGLSVNGSNGSTGSTGITGSLGYTGATGTIGTTGSIGYIGATGAFGSTGNIGSTGSTGNIGSTGTTGSTGFTGSSGSVGSTGSTGSTGVDGALNAWSLTGNAGTTVGTNFIGTTDANDFAIYTNNSEKIRVTSTGNVGIGTNSPNTTLDVFGSTAFRESLLTLANGNNNDINVGNNTFITISGPTLAFAITGISGGTSGRLITLYNSTALPVTISNQNINSIAANRIVTLTGADIIGIAGNGGSVQLQYSASALRWIVINAAQSTPGGLNTDIVELVYDVASGTNGGASVGSVWTTRDINTKLTDFNNICTLAANQFTLPTGTYDVQFNQVFFSEGNTPTQFHSRIKNITSGTTALIALTERAHYPGGTSGNHNCAGSGIIQITSSTLFELQYFAENPLYRGLGYGVSGASGENERYVYIRIKRILP